MKINRNFLIWILLFIASLVGITYYGGSVSYSFFYLCTLIPIISLTYLFIIFFRFRIYQKTEGRNLIVNQPAPFYFTLQNEDLFSYSGIKVSYYSSFSNILDLEDGTEYELWPKKGIEKKTNIVCKYRGEYKVGIKTVEIQDFFKLFKYTYKNPSQLNVIVHPNIVVIDDLKSIDISLITAKESFMNQVAPDVIVRKYIPGDAKRMIEWKSSAKLGEFMVRKTIGEEKYGISVIMSGKRYSDEKKDFLPVENKMIETAIALTYYFVSKNTPVETYLNSGKTIHDCIGNIENFDRYYDAMCIYNFSESFENEKYFKEISQINTVFNNRVVFLVLNKWTDEEVKFAMILNENNISVVAYIITNENVTNDNSMLRTTVFPIRTDANLKDIL